MTGKKTKPAITVAFVFAGTMGVVAANAISKGVHSHGFDARFHLGTGIVLMCGTLIVLARTTIAYFRQRS